MGDSDADRTDPVDHVKDLLEGHAVVDLTDGELKGAMEEELNTLMSRLARLKNLSGRFDGVELSPHVHELAEQINMGQAADPDATDA